MLENNTVNLRCPSLKELLFASEQLCKQLSVVYDPSKITVTTDYGVNVVIIYRDDSDK